MADLPIRTSQRGFNYHAPIPSEYGGHITVSESSAANGPHIWVRAVCPADLNHPDGPTVETAMHLTADNAWLLARQLAAAVVGHYHGDARPSDADSLLNRVIMVEALPDLDSAGSGVPFDPRDVAEHMSADLARRGFVLIYVGTEELP